MRRQHGAAGPSRPARARAARPRRARPAAPPAASSSSRRRSAVRLAAEPGTDRERPRLLRRLRAPPPTSPSPAPAAAPRRRAASARARRRRRSPHRRGKRLRREADGAGHPWRAADDEHRAGRVLVVLGRLRGTSSRIAGVTSRSSVSAGSSPISAIVTSPVWKSPGAIARPDLDAVEGDGQRGPHGLARDLTGRRVDARGDVDRDDRCAGGVDPLDRGGGLRTRLAVEAGAEEGVDDHVGLLDGGRLDRVAALLAEDAGGDPAVAPVRAAAADDGDPPSVGERAAAPRGRPRPRPAPSARRRRGPPRRPASPRPCRAARASGDRRRRRPRRRARASASSRGRSSRPRPSPPRRRRGPTAAPTASAGPRSRCPSRRTRGRRRSRAPSRPPPCPRSAPRSSRPGSCASRSTPARPA